MSFQTNNSVIKWVDDRLPVFTMMHHAFIEHPYPRNLNVAYQFGSILGVVLVVQILSGIVLAMHYTPHVDLAFSSVEHIMRDVNFGWLLRYMHANGASMFFIAVYLHMFRGLYYGSYKAPREMIWFIGVVILLVMMATAFMGYVLPWGQMSFWGATVITNLFSALPVVGEPIVNWLWGGFAVDNATLARFFSLHYLLPFVIFGLVFLHLVALHQKSSTNPLGIEIKGPADYISFHPYFTVKDALGFALFGLLFAFFIFFAPNYLGHPDNNIPADRLSTPAHIVPEWYFLPFYAILRAIPDKLMGVIAMFAAIAVLFVLPWLDRSKVRSAAFRPQYKLFFWIFVLDCLVLGYAGSQPPEGTMLVVGQLATAYYFIHFLIIMPLLGWFERPKPLPTSIAEAVLGSGKTASADATAAPKEKA